MKRDKPQLHKMFEHLIRTKAEVSRQTWLDLNVEGVCRLKLTDRQVKSINRRFGLIVEATNDSITLRQT